MFKNELWFNATNPDSENLLTDNTTVFKPMYLDRAADDPIWLYINNKMNTNKQLDINNLLHPLLYFLKFHKHLEPFVLYKVLFLILYMEQ